MSTRHLGFGLAFGFVLQRAGASSYDAIAGMFLGRDLHLVGVIGVAIATTALGFFLLRRGHVRARDGAPLALQPKPMQKGLVAGGLLFGAGWAIAGACPGTALVQLGEGQLAATATVAGILAGAWFQQRTARARALPARPAAPPDARLVA